MRTTMKLGLAVLALLIGAAVWSQTTKPTTEPVKISDAAKPLIESMNKGYARLKSLDLVGKLSLNIEAAGSKSEQTSDFTGAFSSPAKFRHEMQDDALVSSDEKNAYVYLISKKRYLQLDAPKDRSSLDDIPEPIVDRLVDQDPSLLLALVTDAGTTFAATAVTADRGADVTLDGKTYQSLVLTNPRQQVTALVDPASGLLRRVSVDLKNSLVARGVPNVSKALLTIDYTKTDVDRPMAAVAFTWTPPADALQDHLPPPGAEGADMVNEDAVAMESKPAPNFTLNDLNDKPVSLASLKGNVVVLDFWATWCVPCVESMPHLDAMSKQLSARGLRVLAIDMQENKQQIQKFLTEQKIGLPVLLDTDAKVAQLFKVQPLPQTVVIGRDGTVRKVFIGITPGGDDQLREVVEAALK